MKKEAITEKLRFFAEQGKNDPENGYSLLFQFVLELIVSNSRGFDDGDVTSAYQFLVNMKEEQLDASASQTHGKQKHYILYPMKPVTTSDRNFAQKYGDLLGIIYKEAS